MTDRPPLDPDDRATVTGIAVLIVAVLVGAGLLWALFATPLPAPPPGTLEVEVEEPEPDEVSVPYVSPRLAATVSRHQRVQAALSAAEALGDVGDPWRDAESLDARGRVAVAMRAQRAAEEREASRRAAAFAAPAPAPTSTPAAGGGNGDPWTRLAQCESGGNPRAVSPSGRYSGLLQFDLPTWASVGMTGDPIDHPAAAQIEAGRRLHAMRGWQPWPACSRALGLR